MNENNPDIKNKLVRRLKELLLCTEFDKIGVVFFSKYAYINRNTFYYHFSNMQELARYMLEEDIRAYKQRFPEKKYLTIFDMKLLLLEGKKVYVNLFQSSAYDILLEQLMKEASRYIRNIITKQFPLYSPSEEEITLLVFMQSMTAVSLLALWAKGGMKADCYNYNFTELRERCIQTSLEFFKENPYRPPTE